MHLGLNRRVLCAPYRIMGAVAPRLKIMMASGSKKGTQIYYLYSLKSPSKRTPSRFPSGDRMERDTRLQGIFISLKDLIKIPLIRRPQERSVHPCSLKRGPYGSRRLGSPVKEPYHKVPFMESLAERYPVPRALLHPSFKVPGIRASPPDTRFPSVIKGPL